MLKAVLCLICLLVLAVVMLQLRQQRMELNYTANSLHDQIKRKQSELWAQQLQVSMYTAPNSVEGIVSGLEVPMRGRGVVDRAVRTKSAGQRDGGGRSNP